MTRRESVRATAGLTVVAALVALTLAAMPDPSAGTAVSPSVADASADEETQGVSGSESVPADIYTTLAHARALNSRTAGRSAERTARIESDALHARLAAIADEARRVGAVRQARIAGEIAARRAAEEKARREAEARAAAKVAEEPREVESPAAAVVRPATGRITSPFGMRTHPITGVLKLHDGTDFARGDGNAYAAMAGVARVSHPAWAGTLVTVDHGSVQTTYGHLDSASVSSGERVNAGDVVGRIGSAGYSTGPHLHFSVLINGNYTNPATWLESKGAL
jgi:murein DD-endopeptidase MepM/ murein hydrolase activator NlpD